MHHNPKLIVSVPTTGNKKVSDLIHEVYPYYQQLDTDNKFRSFLYFNSMRFELNSIYGTYTSTLASTNKTLYIHCIKVQADTYDGVYVDTTTNVSRYVDMSDESSSSYTLDLYVQS